MSPKMSLQPLFMKLIHLLNHIYSDRIRHIPSRIPSVALKQCLLDEDANPPAAASPPYLAPTMAGNGFLSSVLRGNFSGKSPHFCAMENGANSGTSSLYFCPGEQTRTDVIRWIAAVSVTLINPRLAPRKGPRISLLKALQSDV